MKAKWMDIEEKVWFIEQKGCIKMYSTVTFQIVMAYTTTKNIFRTVVDEGASTCVMSLACWKAIGQPVLSPSPTLLTAFDGCSF
jgi:hypothetical protein